MRILIAPDKFKGSLTAPDAADLIAQGIQRALPAARCHKMPMADGGEGTTEMFVRNVGGQMIECPATDALGKPIKTVYGWMPSLKQAVIEMSAPCGLWRIPSAERDPMRAGTRGLGTMLLEAEKLGATRIIVGLGGSATNDGGAGMAAALGYRFLDENGEPVDPIPANFLRIARITPPSQPYGPAVAAISDVRNPLLGERGASRVYGPQKGATPEMVEALEGALAHLAAVVCRDLHRDFRDKPGAGAAGGLGFGLLSFCHATIQSGFDAYAEMMDIELLIRNCDLVVTGEGLIDSQSLEGKGPGELARLARKVGKPVIALCGAVRGEEELHDVFDACFAIANRPMSADESIDHAAELLVLAAERVGKLLALSKKL